MMENIDIWVAEDLLEMVGQETRRGGGEHMRFRFARDMREQRLVPHHGKGPGLLINGARRLDGRIDERPQQVLIDRLRGEFAHRAPRKDRLFEIHGATLHVELQASRKFQNRSSRLPIIDSNQGRVALVYGQSLF